MKIKRFGARKLLQCVATVALVGVMAGLLPAQSYAAEGGGYYESEMFGFTVEWDEAVWTGEPIPGDEVTEGVAMDTPLTWGNIRASAWPEVDEEACVEYMADSFEEGEGIKNVKRASRSLEMPSDDLGGEAGLYIMTMDSAEDGDTDVVMYLQCVSFADEQAALTVMLIANQSAYESELPAWNELIAGIDPGDGPVNVESRAQQEETDEPAGNAGSYVNDDFGFAVRWDEDVWTGVEFDNGDKVGVDMEDELSFGSIFAAEGYEDLTAEDCVDSLASTMEESDAFKRVRKDSDLPALETDPDAFGQVYTMLYTDAPTKLAVYIECRPLPETEYFLIVHLTANANDYEDETSNWQDLIDGIELTESASTGSRDEDDPIGDEPSRTRGGEFAGVHYDFAVAYDEDVWTAEEYTEEDFDWLGLTSEYGQVTIIATSSDVDLQGCLDTLLEDEYDYATGNIDPAPRSFDLPETARDAEGALYAYEGVTEDGEPVDTIVYFECRAIDEGESLIGITFVTTPEQYEDALPALEELLNGIEIG